MPNKKFTIKGGNTPYRQKANFGAIAGPLIQALGTIGSQAITQISENNARKEAERRQRLIDEYNAAVQQATSLSNNYANSEKANRDYINQYHQTYAFGGNRSLSQGGQRPKAFWGAVIAAGVSLASAIANNMANSSRRRKQLAAQHNADDYNNTLDEAMAASKSYAENANAYNNYLSQFNTLAKYGTKKRTLKAPIITDGGDAEKIGNSTFLLRGSSHEDINEAGKTGIGIALGNGEIEAENGEVAQLKGNKLRIFSDQPILNNGISPALAVVLGANKNKVFNAQERFKREAGIDNEGNVSDSSPVKKMIDNRSRFLAGGFLDRNLRFVDDYQPYVPSTTLNIDADKLKAATAGLNNGSVVDGTNKAIVGGINNSGMKVTTGDWIGLGADLIGSIGSSILANRGLKEAYVPERPGYIQAGKLKTNYNINPQLEVLENSRRRMNKDIDDATSSSVAALNRRNYATMRTDEEINKLYGQKENMETDLINKDILNQQDVATKNVQLQADWANRVAQFKNDIDNRRIAARTMSLKGISGAARNFLGQAMQRYEDTQAMRYALAASDNGTFYRMMNSGVDLDQDTITQGLLNEYNSNRSNPGDFVFIEGEDPKETSRRRAQYDRDKLLFNQSADVMRSAYSRLNNRTKQSLLKQGFNPYRFLN